MNALVKNGSQPPTPELRTDFATDTAAELSNLQARNFQAHPGLETHLETTLRRLKSSQDAPLANQQLALIHLETNEKECLRRQGDFEKIWVAVRKLVLAPLTLETIQRLIRERHPDFAKQAFSNGPWSGRKQKNIQVCGAVFRLIF